MHQQGYVIPALIVHSSIKLGNGEKNVSVIMTLLPKVFITFTKSEEKNLRGLF